MHSPIPHSTLFNESTFDLIVPETVLDAPEPLSSLQQKQRNSVYFDELLTFYLCITVPLLESASAEGSKLSMLEHWVGSLEITVQSMIHDGSGLTLPLPPPPTSILSPLAKRMSLASPDTSNSIHSSSSLSTTSDISARSDSSLSSHASSEPVVRFRQHNLTYNRRAPGSKPLIHVSSGTILVPLRIPVAFTSIQSSPSTLSMMIMVTQSMLVSAAKQDPLKSLLPSASEWMPDLHDTVNILGSLHLEQSKKEVVDKADTERDLPSLRIQKFRSHGFQTVPLPRRILQRKLRVQNALSMSMICLPQRARDHTVLLNVLFENTTDMPLTFVECVCKEAPGTLVPPTWPIQMSPRDQLSLIFVYPTDRWESSERFHVTLVAYYALHAASPMCSQWTCLVQNPLPILRTPNEPHTSPDLLLPPKPKPILKKRLSLTEEALLQVTKVFSKPLKAARKPSLPVTQPLRPLPAPPSAPPVDFPLILTFLTPDPIYEQATFYLTLQMINRSPKARQVSIKVPNRSAKSKRPSMDKLFLTPLNFEEWSMLRHSTSENLLCLENELHLKSIPPDSTFTVRIQFQALRKGIHVIDTLYLTDHASHQELEIKDSLQVYVRPQV